MTEKDITKDSTIELTKDKKKKENEKKLQAKKTREETQRMDTQAVQDVKPDSDENEQDLNLSNSATSLSPSAIIEMFHLQGDENARGGISGAITARYLVENEGGDFYQVRSKEHKVHKQYPRYRRTSMSKAQHNLRDSSTKTERILTGMCWMDTINLRSGAAESSTIGVDGFLCAYSAGANRSRQIFFVLFNGVLIGLMRELSRMDPHQEYKAFGGGSAAELTSYRLLQVATALLSTGLLVLLVGSPSALRLSRAQQMNARWCQDVAMLSPIYKSGILTLQVCAILNTTLVTTAWILVSLQCSATMSFTTANSGRIVELQDALSAHKKRMDELQGTYLDGTSVEDLKSLIQLHNHAIELTEGVLVAKLQAQHKPTAAS